MNFAICDDNEAICHAIKDHITNYFIEKRMEPPECTVYNSGKEIVDSSKNHDIVFIDVEMPEMDGVSACRILSSRYSHSLFVMITSHAAYVDDAFRLNAFRFLTKPIDWTRFDKCLSEAIYVSVTYNRKIAISHKLGISTVYTADIISVESENRKVYIKTSGCETPYLSDETMAHWEKELLGCAGFYSPHRSYIINFEHISRIDNENNLVIMDSGDSIYISRRKSKDFRNSYLTYLKNVT